MNELTIIILTYNEEIHIERCIKSLKSITNNIFVIDSYSTDKTIELAQNLGATVYQNSWINYATQFQWALDHCAIKTPWVMRLDADEYLNAEMQLNINNTLRSLNDNITGLRCSLRNVYLGKTIKYGGYDPLSLLRIWRTGIGRIESRWMDEHMTLSHGQVIKAPGELLHNNLNNHHWWTDKHNNYANREMIDILAKKYDLLPQDLSIQNTDNPSAKFKRFLKENIYNNLPLFFRPTLYFFYRYILRLGFLDGKVGFAYHFFQAYWYRCLVDVRVLEIEQAISKTSGSKKEISTAIKKMTGYDIDA